MHLLHELPTASGYASFDAIPDSDGVLLLEFEAGEPYLGRTSRLRQRLKRLLGSSGDRFARLREATRRASYQTTGSPFESMWLLYQLARHHKPHDYRQQLRLRPPPFLKVLLGNPYPRTMITRRLTRTRALFFGPFRKRSSAERFQEAMLDQFKIRRCEENLDPSPSHPGCIYGEMDMCLRPCQVQSTIDEYHGEVGRVLRFLNTSGNSLVREIEKTRDYASENLEFEQAATLHKRLEKIQASLRLKDELARDLDRFYGFVIQRSASPESVEIWPIHQACIQPNLRFDYGTNRSRPQSLDSQLREVVERIGLAAMTTEERADHLSLLNRWYHSSWRQGELLLFGGMDQIPYRKLVRAVSRVASRSERP